MKSFQKSVLNPTNKFFKKATGDANKFFKKGGQFQKTVGKVAGGLGSASRVLGKGLNAGNQILDAVNQSPFGRVLSPITSTVKTGLNFVGMANKAAGSGSHMLKNVISGRNAGEITNSILNRAKQSQRDINRLGKAKMTERDINPLEKYKPVDPNPNPPEIVFV